MRGCAPALDAATLCVRRSSPSCATPPCTIRTTGADSFSPATGPAFASPTERVRLRPSYFGRRRLMVRSVLASQFRAHHSSLCGAMSTSSPEVTGFGFQYGFHETVVAFARRIIALAVVIALGVPLTAASRLPHAAAVPCQPCVECNDDAAPQVVRVRMYNQTRFEESAFVAILEVTNSIWAPYGLNVEAATSADAITVVVSKGVRRGDVEATPIPVGDTLFTKHHATPYIHLWLGAAELLAQNS